MERSVPKNLKASSYNVRGSSSDKCTHFDASRYSFFGKDIVQEVDMESMQDEDDSDCVPVLGGGFGSMDAEDDMKQYHLFDKEEGSGFGSSFDLDDLAMTFS